MYSERGVVAVRALALVALLMAGGVAIGLGFRRQAPLASPQRLTWIATAHQLGPVGYRDPVGAISPDGRWLAYSEGRFLRVRPVGGGPIVDFPPGDFQIRHLSWRPDNRSILTDGGGPESTWVAYDLTTRARGPLWPGRKTLSATIDRGDGSPSTTMTIGVGDLRQPMWSPDGQSIAATVNGREGPELWTVSADGSMSRARRVATPINSPSWSPSGDVACIALDNGHPRVTIPCGGRPLPSDPALDIYGPLAFSPDGAHVYAGAANSSGTVDLWSLPVGTGSGMISARAQRLTSFSRDSYAPTRAPDGSVIFKVQSYRTMVAMIHMKGDRAAGHFVMPLVTFQSETPSWDWSGRWIGLTFGTWRRVVDDAKYPDISQDTGIIAVDSEHPADKPASIVHASQSEDQALCWSPNGRWLAFHSHRDQSDDIWLRSTGDDFSVKQLTFLGRGAETGWPRWSPDGRWLLFDGAPRPSRKPTMFVMGINQETGAVTMEPREVTVQGVPAVISHGEWLPDSAHVVAIGKEGPGQHIIFTVGRDGGVGRVVHRFTSEHDTPGLAVSPDGREVAFVAPAADGFFQLYRMPIEGGAPTQVTTDPSHKTQPAWSPDGRWLAFTIWSYDAQFWAIR